jgi:hypothetical protein
MPEASTHDTASTKAPLPEDTLILDGRFRLKRIIGEGGMGLVYLGEQVSLGRQVAVKVLREDLSLQAGMGERFRREALLLSSVDHAAVVRVIDFGMHGASACLVMELATGETLEAALRTETFTPERSMRLLIQLAQGLAAIHEKGIVHRDLKPENIVLTKAADGEQARLLDFGIARLASPENAVPGTGGVTQVGLVLGTPEYLSPEQALGQPLDPRTDIYSFGVVAYRMLSGKLPFEGPSLAQFIAQHATQAPKQLLEAAPQLFKHSALATLVMSCLAKMPAERPQTAVALANELARFSVTMPDAPAPLLLTASITGGFKPIEAAPPGGDVPWALTGPAGMSSPTKEHVALPPARAKRRFGWKLKLAATVPLVLVVAALAALMYFAPERRARRLLDVGRGSEALQIIDEAKPSPALSMLKAAALHQVNRHDEELELMKTVPQGVPLEPHALEALADDFGRKADDKAAAPLRQALADFPKGSALPLLQTLATQPLENPPRAVTWAQWGALRFIDLEYAGQGLPLVDLYLRSLESSDCRVRALTAKRLGELRNGAALEPLKKLRDLPHKKDDECGQSAAGLAVKSLEKDLNP